MAMGFPPIDSYAFLSDCHTAALVGPDGGIEWCCVPDFAGDAVFARLLDREAGGFFALSVDGCPAPARSYLPDTLVVQSRYDAPTGSATGHDFLAVGRGDPARPVRAGKILARRVTVDRGTVRLRARISPRPGYGARGVRWDRIGDDWQARGTPLRLTTTLPVRVDDAALTVEAELHAGQTVGFLLAYDAAAPTGSDPTELLERSDSTELLKRSDPTELLERTCQTWRWWSDRSEYAGFAARTVRHSALVLRGLSYDETGALLAAPTTSLPEELGGVRNWDYRYTWHRDAALLLLALFRLGHAEEGRRYLHFLLSLCAGQELILPVVDIHGDPAPAEEPVPHLRGYADSAPVRVGNGAADQAQFDIYGHVLGAALAYQRLTGDLTDDQWQLLCRHVDTMADRWREPDHGVWEIRGPRRHYVNSKVMTWVCLDSGIHLAQLLDDRDAPVDRWRRARDELRAEILDRGYDPTVGSFVLAYGSTEIDASLLRIPLVGFLPGDDPRVLSTIDRIRRRLAIGPALIHRYRTDDGLPGAEGAFLLCCFELVSALVLAGRRDEAGQLFDRLTSSAGPLGLYSEQLAADGTALGNYPQAFTHLALIEAALNIDAAGGWEALRSLAEGNARNRR